MDKLASSQTSVFNNLDSRDSRLGDLLRATVTDWEKFEREQSSTAEDDKRYLGVKRDTFNGFAYYTHSQTEEEGQIFELESGQLIRLGILCIQQAENMLSNNPSTNGYSTNLDRQIKEIIRTDLRKGGSMDITLEHMVSTLPDAVNANDAQREILNTWGSTLVEEVKPQEARAES